MTWSEYMQEHGQEEYRAWESAIKPLTDKIERLKLERAELVEWLKTQLDPSKAWIPDGYDKAIEETLEFLKETP